MVETSGILLCIETWVPKQLYQSKAFICETVAYSCIFKKQNVILLQYICPISQ